MIQNCKMRHENGNCLPAGGFCTANKNICEALQNAYEMGQRNAIRKNGKWHKRFYSQIEMMVCSECNSEFSYDAETGVRDYNFCPSCGSDMRERKES